MPFVLLLLYSNVALWPESVVATMLMVRLLARSTLIGTVWALAVMFAVTAAVVPGWVDTFRRPASSMFSVV